MSESSCSDSGGSNTSKTFKVPSEHAWSYESIMGYNIHSPVCSKYILDTNKYISYTSHHNY